MTPRERRWHNCRDPDARKEGTCPGRQRCTLAPATLAALARYDWPGNVRELQNVMAALAVSAGRRGSVGPEQLPSILGGQGAAAARTMAEARRAFEAGIVRTALARAGGHRAQAAGELGLTRQGLAKLMARLGIDGRVGPSGDGRINRRTGGSIGASQFRLAIEGRD